MLADNLKSVTRRIAKGCEKSGTSPHDVQLVCVSKEASIDQMREAIEAGAGIFGENRVQDALEKYSAIGDKVSWHLVGHLQTNKAKDAVRIFSLIHSVDSLRIAEAIDKEAGKAGKVQDVLVQVNVSGEETKFGVSPDELMPFLKAMALYQNISIKGFMTIAPEADDTESVRPFFRELREIRDSLNTIFSRSYNVLSMGMTNDFEVAVEEGSNMVRIGRAIFNG